MRSTNADDYQHVPRAVAVMEKTFPARSGTGRHSHPRAQLLFASAGVMVATLDEGTWIVPPGYALWIPAGLEHNVAMHGVVSMLTAYIDQDQCAEHPGVTRVIEVTPLLNVALAALAAEPVLYAEQGRGGHLAALVLDEVARAPETALALPLPRHERLRDVCVRLIDDPAISFDLDRWADETGTSRRTLTRRFRDETGLSFGNWRGRARVMKALALLAEGRSQKQTATLVGYQSPQALRTRIDALMAR